MTSGIFRRHKSSVFIADHCVVACLLHAALNASRIIFILFNTAYVDMHKKLQYYIEFENNLVDMFVKPSLTKQYYKYVRCRNNLHQISFL